MKSKNVRRQYDTEHYVHETRTSLTNPRPMGLAIQDTQNSSPHTGTVKATPNMRRRKPGEILRP